MFGMPLAKLVSGLGRPDPTPRTVFVTVHDPDDPDDSVAGAATSPLDRSDVRALLAGRIGRVTGAARRRARVLRRRLRVRRLARSA